MSREDMKSTVRMPLNTDPPTDPQPAIVRIETQLIEILAILTKEKHMKLNLQAVHYLVLVCASLTAGLPQLEAAFPPGATPWLKGATAVCGLLTGVFGVLSPGAMIAK